MTDKKKRSAAGGGLGLWIGLTTAALLIVIGIAIFGLLSGNSRNERQDEVASNGNLVRDIADIVVDTGDTPGLANAGMACRTDGNSIGTIGPGEGMEIANPRGTTTYYSPDPTAADASVTVCSKLHPDRCITSEQRSIRGIGPVVVMTNTGSQAVNVTCLTIPAS